MKCSLGVVALASLSITFLFAGCAHEEKGVDFRPIQLSWVSESATADENPNKDACVVRLTAALMGEPQVQASNVEEIAYRVTFRESMSDSGTLEFTGACTDVDLKDTPEYSWEATCDSDLKIVVKFHNGH